MIHKIYMHKQDIYEYIMFTVASAVMVVGIYFFKFPNHFSFGGVSGLSIVLAELLPRTPGNINLIINLCLLVIGFMVFGKEFGVRIHHIGKILILLHSLDNAPNRLFPVHLPKNIFVLHFYFKF